MKKKYNILALAAFSPLMLTGCSNEQTKALNNLEENIISVLKNNVTIKNEFVDSEQFNYKFTAYEVFDNDKNQTLNLFGKLFDDSKNSYLKLSYDIDYSNYDFSNEVESYKSIANIVKDNENYLLNSVDVYNYNNFDNVFKNNIPQKDSKKHGLAAFEVLNVDGLSYDKNLNQMNFNSYVLADYKWRTTTIVMAGPSSPVPITNTHHNYETYSYDVKFNVLEEDYNKYKNDTKELLYLLESYVNYGLTNEYSINEAPKIINRDVPNNIIIDEKGM